MELRKIGILGVGHVGAHVAYTLALQGLADELVLVDISQQKVTSECQDLRDAVAYMPHRVAVNVGNFSDFGDCGILINCVGKSDLLSTKSRISEMQFTIPMVNEFAHKIKESGFSGILLNITNPCDVITRQLAGLLKFPKGRVFGTGSGLDTSRLLSALARQTGIDHKSITAYMIGEHGNAQFAPWSCVGFRGKRLADWSNEDPRFCFDHEELQREVINGGWVTVAGKNCTEYGIASTAARVVGIILHDEKAIMPVSMELNGEYGEKDIFVGVPCVIGKDGVEEVVELPLTDGEMEKFHACCESIRENIRHAENSNFVR